MRRPRGNVAPIRPAVETAAFGGAKPRGRFGAAPARGLCKRSPQRPVAGRSVRFLPTDGGRGQGVWGSPRPAVGNCGLRWGETAGGGSAQPPQGAWQTKPATFSCRAFCADSTHGRWPRPGSSGPRGGRQLKTAASTCETARRGWVQPPSGGLANEARNFQLPGVLCGSYPRAVAAAREQCGSEAAGSWKLRPS